MTPGIDIVVVIHVPGIADLDGQDTDNALAELTEAMKGTNLEWRIEEVYGSSEDGNA